MRTFTENVHKVFVSFCSPTKYLDKQFLEREPKPKVVLFSTLGMTIRRTLHKPINSCVHDYFNVTANVKTLTYSGG